MGMRSEHPGRWEQPQVGSTAGRSSLGGSSASVAGSARGHCASSAAGFTLLEVLLALVLVTIGAVAVTQLQAVTISNNALTVQRHEAMRLAESLAARLQTDAYGWTDIQTGLNTGLLTQARIESNDRTVFHAFPSETPEVLGTAARGMNSRGIPTDAGLGLGGGTPFCAYYTIAAPAAGATNLVGVPVLRQAEVRVYWARNRVAETLFVNCVENGNTIVNAGALVPGSTDTVANVGGQPALRPLDVVSVRTVVLLPRNTWWNGGEADDTLL